MRRWLFTAASVIAVASAGVWLLRDARSLIGNVRPAEGSLVVNINTATPAQLETVPGIGPARAAQIIAGRPYGSIDELVRISGIGNATLDGMRFFITIESETSNR